MAIDSTNYDLQLINSKCLHLVLSVACEIGLIGIIRSTLKSTNKGDWLLCFTTAWKYQNYQLCTLILREKRGIVFIANQNAEYLDVASALPDTELIHLLIQYCEAYQLIYKLYRPEKRKIIEIVCDHGDPEMLKYTLAFGALVTIQAIYTVIKQQNIYFLQVLLTKLSESSTDISAFLSVIEKCSNQTVLMTATALGNLEMVEILLSAGADVSRRGGGNQGALGIACGCGNLPMTKLLIL